LLKIGRDGEILPGSTPGGGLPSKDQKTKKERLKNGWTL